MAAPDVVHLLFALSHTNIVGLKSWASDRYSIDNASIAVGEIVGQLVVLSLC